MACTLGKNQLGSTALPSSSIAVQCMTDWKQLRPFAGTPSHGLCGTLSLVKHGITPNLFSEPIYYGADHPVVVAAAGTAWASDFFGQSMLIRTDA